MCLQCYGTMCLHKPSTLFGWRSSESDHVSSILNIENISPRSHLRLNTSALMGDLDPYPQVFQIYNAIPGSVRVSATSAKPGQSGQSGQSWTEVHRATEATEGCRAVQHCTASRNVCPALWKSVRSCRSPYRIARNGNMDNLNFSLLYSCSSSSPVLRVYDRKYYILMVLYYCTCIYTVQSLWAPCILPTTHCCCLPRWITNWSKCSFCAAHSIIHSSMLFSVMNLKT